MCLVFLCREMLQVLPLLMLREDTGGLLCSGMKLTGTAVTLAQAGIPLWLLGAFGVNPKVPVR